MTLTRARTIQYVGILLALALIAVGYWYFSVRAGVKSNTSAIQPQGTGQLDSGLVGYWKFDENTGTSAADSSTNGNTGTLTGSPTWTTGQIGSAVDFDGVDDTITTSSVRGVVNTTMSVWIRPDSVTGAHTVIRHDNNFGIDLTNDEVRWYWEGGSAYHDTTAANLTTGQWYHIVGTYSSSGSSNNVQVYVNGVAQTLNNDDETNTPSAGSGVVANSWLGSYYDGRLDEVRIYDRTLSSDEISQLYRLTSPTSVDTGLKGYWSFDGQDMSSTTAYDRSGAGNNGTLTNGPASVNGLAGQALNFDGTDDYISVPDTTAFTQSALTVSFWKRNTSVASNSKFITKAATNQRSWSIESLDAGRNIQFITSSSGVTETDYGLTPNGGMAVNQWHHVVCVFNGAGSTNAERMQIYINGVAQPITFTGTIPAALVDNTQTVTIGGKSSTAGFLGAMDEVRIYNRALPASEIKSLYDIVKPDATNSASSQAQGTGRLDSGLAGYWTLDENTGTTVNDSSTNGNNGTFVNSPSWTTGRIGSGLTSFSTTTYVSVPHSATLNSLPFSLSFWVKTTDSGSRNIVIGKDYVDGYRCQVSGGNMRCWFITAGGADWYDGGDGHSFGSVADNQWHLITMVITASGGVGYIDGVQRVSQPLTGGSPAAPTGTGALKLGTGSGGDPVNDFTGSLDEVRVYNRALSADEVSQLYRLTSPTGIDTSLKGYWSFNGKDLSGTTAYDRSGAGNNGTLTGGPTGVNGIIGQALSLDGTNDVVQITSDAPNITGALTASFWLKTTATSQKTILGFWQTTGWTVQLDGDGSAPGKLSFYSNNSGFKYASTAVNDGAWHYVAFTLTSGGVLTMYRDGVVDGTYSSVPLPGSYTDDKFFSSVPGGGGYFPGTLDEIRIYDRALTTAEIQEQYEAVKPDKLNSSATQAQGVGRLDSGLAGYWKLDETTGSSAADASTNGNTGTLTNMENGDWTTGQIGNGLDFDGSNEYVAVSTSAALDLDSAHTISAWVKTDVSNTNQMILALGSANCCGTETSLNLIYDSGGGTYRFRFGHTGIAPFASTSDVQTNTWYHVVGVWDGKSTQYIYINGALNNSSALTALSGNEYNNSAYIGSTDVGDYWNGLIDEVRVYHRGLSADEVSQLYRLTSPTGTDTSLKAYWSFNGKDVSGTTAYDRSGMGNNGTLVSGPTVTNGKLGQALSFDGSDDYVNITSMPSAMFSNTTFTVTGWVKTTGDGYVIDQDMCDGGWRVTVGSGYLEAGTRGNGSCGPGGVGRSSATRVDDNRWHHFAVVMTTDTVTSGNNNVVIYIDGALSQGTLTAGVYGAAGDSKVQIGGRYSGFNILPGSIDEVRIYNRGLTAAEVLSLYNQSR